MKRLFAPIALTIAATLTAGCQSLSTPEPVELRGTGDLGLIIERATGSVLVVDHSEHEILGRVEGLGDLSHASVVYSQDARYGYVFGRDGGLTKVDLLTRTVTDRVIQSGNSIGGDRKSTRLNSSHVRISYAVFC